MKEITIEELKDLLHKEKVSFEYKKKDGNLRQATGTLNEDLIPQEKKPKSKRKTKNLRYFDIDKNSWRSVYSETTTINLL